MNLCHMINVIAVGPVDTEPMIILKMSELLKLMMKFCKSRKCRLGIESLHRVKTIQKGSGCSEWNRTCKSLPAVVKLLPWQQPPNWLIV